MLNYNYFVKKTLLLTVLFLPILFAEKKEEASQQNYLNNVLYVKFKPVAKKQNQISNSINNFQSIYRVKQISQPFLLNNKNQNDENFLLWYKIEFQENINISNAIEELKKDASVEYVEPSYIYKVDTTFTPNDPMHTSMWNLKKIFAEDAWSVTKGDTNVVIGICDTGVDYLHEDLSNNIYFNKGEIGLDGFNKDKKTNKIDDDGNGFVDDWRGWDFVGSVTSAFIPDNDVHPYTGNAHGTHVAGTASAVTNNQKGISSIGFNCKIIATKNSSDESSSRGIYFGYEGIIYLINIGCDVINASWGGNSSWSKFQEDVILYGLKKNVLIVAAAGNGNSSGVGLNNDIDSHFPSGYPGVFSIGATDGNDKKASFSNYGSTSTVKVFAPGVNILSTVVGGNYSSSYSGTSMASPLVAGLAGLVKSKNPTWEAGKIMLQIAGTSDPIDALNPNYSGKLGYGRINAKRALTETPQNIKPNIKFISVNVSDSTFGNKNNILEPGEKVEITFAIWNNWGEAKNLSANLITSPDYNWATTIEMANLSIGNLPGIVNYDSSFYTNKNNPFVISISKDAIPINIPLKIKINAENNYSNEYNFNISVSSKLLFVDDDDGLNNIEKYYFNAFSKLNIVYDYYNHTINGAPSYDLLKNYNTVVWACEWTFPALDSADRKSISKYLDNGGKLFISGQDIGWDLCDAGGATVNNEFAKSKGESKIFYEKYLKAKYLADNGGKGLISGVIGDTITDGLQFYRNQPGRKEAEQFGDVIEAVNGSREILKLTSGSFINKAGAVSYNGNYKLVNFGFGGFEAITDSNMRLITMDRIINWMSGYSVELSEISDNENTTKPFPVKAKVNGEGEISANLFWSNTGVLPFTKSTMVKKDSNNFYGEIPIQSLNSTIYYFVLIKAGTQFLPFKINKFNIFADTVGPNIVFADTIQNTINLKGPFPFKLNIFDRSGIDSNNIFLSYLLNGSNENKIKLFPSGNKDEYEGKILFDKILTSGDVITYQFYAKDISNAKNISVSPNNRFYKFVVGRELLDDFENAKKTSEAWYLNRWGFDNTIFNSKNKSFTDSPDGLYETNDENILTYKPSFDLTIHNKVQINFYRKIYIDNTDTLFFEVSPEFFTWIKLKSFTGLDSPFEPMTKESFILDYSIFKDTKNFKLRFRLKSDSLQINDGAYIDDIEILTGQLTKVENSTLTVVSSFELFQNYPNPFNPTTNIKFSIPNESNVTLKIYNILGKEVATLINNKLNMGNHSIVFNGKNLESGIYFYELKSGTNRKYSKMILLK